MNITRTIFFSGFIALGFLACGDGSDDKTNTRDNNVITETIPTEQFTNIRVDILPAGEIRTILVNTDEKASYSLQNNPSWISVDSSSGIVTFKAPQDSNESYAFEIIANVSGVKTLSNTIKGHVEHINQNLDEEFSNPNIVDIEDTLADLRSVRFGSVHKIPNSLNTQGETTTWDTFAVYYENYHKNIEVVIIDGDTNKVQHVYIESGAWNGSSTAISKEGNFYFISTHYNVTQMNMYNPRTNEFKLDVVKFPNDTAGALYNKMRIAPDKTLFISCTFDDENSPLHRNPRYFEIDTATNTIIEGTGEAIEQKEFPLTYAVDNTYIYYTLGTQNGHLAYQYQRAAPHTTTLLGKGPDGYVHVGQSAYGAYYIEDKKKYFLYEGKRYLVEDGRTLPPWPFPESFTMEKKLHTVSNSQRGKNSISYYFSKSSDVITQNATVVNSKAELWVKQPETQEYIQSSYALKTYQNSIHQVLKLSNGKILYSANAYGPYGLYDPLTQTFEQQGSIGLSGYTMLDYKKEDGTNVVYLSGYPRGALYEYNYNEPWTQQQHTWKAGDEVIDYQEQSLNPRFCGSFGFNGSGIHKMFASAIGADGYVYFGGQDIRASNHGGIGWYNPNETSGNGTTDSMDGQWEEHFSNYAISDLTAILGGKYIVISTIPVTDVYLKKPKATTGRLFLFDVFKKEVVSFYDPLKELNLSTGDIIGVDNGYIIGATVDSKNTYYIYRMNMLNGVVEYINKIERSGSRTNSGTRLVKTDDGKIMFYTRENTSELDPISGKITVRNRYIVDGNTRWGQTGEMTIDGENIYIGGHDSLYKASSVRN